MKILVDADACPVKDIIVETAKIYSLEVIMFTDTCHFINDDYSKIITVDKASDSVDFAIANNISAGDIAVTQDYGLASMLMAKKAYVLHQNGFLYTEDNIDRMLFERHISKEMRRKSSHKKGGKFKPRTSQDNEKFKKCLIELIEKLIENQK